MGQWLSDRLGQPFIIENRTGAGSNIATEVVVRAPPDGYTLLLVAPANTINATLYDKLNFNFIHDIAPVASIARSFYVMEVHPSVPVKTVSEFIAYAKANPGKINMASAGSGTPQHVAGELFKIMTGVDMVHVPYRGAAPALTDLIGGQVQVMFDNMSSSIEHIEAGKLRPLAVTTATRYGAMPDIPTVGNSVPGFEASGQFGFGTPGPYCCHRQAERRNQRRPLRSTITGRLADLASEVLAGTRAAYAKLMGDETQRWGKVVPGRATSSRSEGDRKPAGIPPRSSRLQWSNATGSMHTENRSMSTSLRERPSCCVAAKRREVPQADVGHPFRTRLEPV